MVLHSFLKWCCTHYTNGVAGTPIIVLHALLREVFTVKMQFNSYMFPRVFGDEFGDSLNLVTKSVMNFVNH